MEQVKSLLIQFKQIQKKISQDTQLVCCAKDNTQYRTWVTWCGATEYPVSSSPSVSSKCTGGFIECRPLAGEYTAQKIIRI